MLVANGRDALAGGKATKNVTTKSNNNNGNMHEPFVFVPITQSEAAKGRGAAKRIVRAHVTRVQHQKSSTLNGMDLQSWTVKPYIHRDVPVRKKPKSTATAEKKRDTAAAVKTRKSPSVESSSSSSSTDSDDGSQVLLIPRIADNGAEDPFWTFPVDYKPEIAPIFAHYIQNIAVELEDLDGPNERGLLRKSLFPLCMTEASTMYAVLLMGASHFAIVNPEQGSLIDLLALKARALKEINSALADPQKAVTDAVIMAVAKIAAYESIFGDSEVFAAHMKGLQMMLKMRGGLSTLGLNGFLERMLVWIDLNACHLTGQSVFLGGEDLPTIVEFEGPDPFHFAGIQ